MTDDGRTTFGSIVSTPPPVGETEMEACLGIQIVNFRISILTDWEMDVFDFFLSTPFNVLGIWLCQVNEWVFTRYTLDHDGGKTIVVFFFSPHCFPGKLK